MHQVEQKRLLIERIVPHLIAAPADVVQRLLQKSVNDLEMILEDAITKKAQVEARQEVNAHVEEMRAASVSEAAWTHACRALIKDKRLSIIQSNRDLLESLLNPGEEPSAKLYIALAQQYPQRFAWSSPPTTQTDQERRANFVSICRQHGLSQCVANEHLHKAGIATEQWAGASQVELLEFQADAALARQKWLVNGAGSTELRAEARYEAQTQLAANQQAQADASLQAQKQRDQYAGYKPLPAHIDRKALIKASKDELRRWSRLYGQFQLNTEVNHALVPSDESPKQTEPVQEFHPNGRRNHAFKANTDEPRKPVPKVDAWKEIADLYLRRWTTHGQQATLQAEYDRGIATGKSWREIGAVLGQIVKGWERGR